MNTKLPLLLVSVRSAAEAREAILGGADIIDVKEPDRGPLGAADPLTLLDIAREVGHQKPLSAAMGELLAKQQAISLKSLEGYRWIKLGFSGCEGNTPWHERWEALEQVFVKQCRLVAASYADHAAARCQPPISIAKSLPLRDSIFLVDTFTKSGKSLFDVMSRNEIVELRTYLHSHGAQLALAGSLRAELAEQIAQCAPDIVGIRGAACASGRSSHIVAERVRAFRAALSAACSANSPRLQATHHPSLGCKNFA